LPLTARVSCRRTNFHENRNSDIYSEDLKSPAEIVRFCPKFENFEADQGTNSEAEFSGAKLLSVQGLGPIQPDGELQNRELAGNSKRESGINNLRIFNTIDSVKTGRIAQQYAKNMPKPS